MTRHRPRHRFVGATHMVARQHRHDWREVGRQGMASGEYAVTEECKVCSVRRLVHRDRDEQE